MLYFFSDMLAFVLEKILKYRRGVIEMNLRNSFPTKTEEDLTKIKNEFYRHFSDLFVEVLKSISMSEQEAKKRVCVKNSDCLNHFFDEGKDVILVLGHYGNWELTGMILPFFIQHDFVGIYSPLKNTFFNKKIKSIRSMFGAQLVPMADANKVLKYKENKPRAFGFIGDQSPSNPARSHWALFLNQDTPILMGTERLSKIYDLPVVYTSLQKKQRGHYEILFSEVTANPKLTAKGEITETHTAHLEKDIISKPSFWLWSHKRWKHRRKKDA